MPKLGKADAPIGRLRRESGGEHRISHETIYQFVYSDVGRQRISSCRANAADGASATHASRAV